jgi:probable phosphoglycerate mutase
MITPILPAKPFFLLRHGQTTVNRDQVIGDGGDYELTDLGVQQAKNVGKWIQGLIPQPTHIIRSDRSRTRITAENTNTNMNLPVDVEPLIDEINFGDWVGRPSKDAFADLYDKRISPPNGEGVKEFTDRVHQGLKKILNNYPEHLLIVAHGGTFRAIAELYQKPLWQVGNCQLHYFEPTKHRKDFPWNVMKLDYNQDGLTRELIKL